MEVKDLLLPHLEKEDTELYPALRKASETDQKLKANMDLFEEQIMVVSEVAEDFFKRYKLGCSGLEFIQDFGSFMIMLKDRMAREENILFAEYERLCSSEVH